MPTVNVSDAEIYYEASGDAAETVVFLGEIGFGAWAWGWQYRALTGPYQTIVFDTRGCGQSQTHTTEFDFETLVSDLVSVLRATDTRSAHLIGCGLGGAVALIAAKTTNRAKTLTLIGTAATGSELPLSRLAADPQDHAALRDSTTTAVSAAFADEQPTVIEQIIEWRSSEDASLEQWSALAETCSAYDATPLYECTVPSLVLHGEVDQIVPLEAAKALADGLPRSELIPIDSAGHLPQIEHSRVVNDHILGFLDEQIEDGYY